MTRISSWAWRPVFVPISGCPAWEASGIAPDGYVIIDEPEVHRNGVFSSRTSSPMEASHSCSRYVRSGQPVDTGYGETAIVYENSPKTLL